MDYGRWYRRKLRFVFAYFDDTDYSEEWDDIDTEEWDAMRAEARADMGWDYNDADLELADDYDYDFGEGEY